MKPNDSDGFADAAQKNFEGVLPEGSPDVPQENFDDVLPEESAEEAQEGSEGALPEESAEEAQENSEDVLPEGSAEEAQEGSEGVLPEGSADEAEESSEGVLELGSPDEIQENSEGVFNIGFADEAEENSEGVFQIGFFDEDEESSDGVVEFGSPGLSQENSVGVFNIGFADEDEESSDGVVEFGSPGMSQENSEGVFQIGFADEAEESSDGVVEFGSPDEVQENSEGVFQVGSADEAEESSDGALEFGFPGVTQENSEGVFQVGSADEAEESSDGVLEFGFPGVTQENFEGVFQLGFAYEAEGISYGELEFGYPCMTLESSADVSQESSVDGSLEDFSDMILDMSFDSTQEGSVDVAREVSFDGFAYISLEDSSNIAQEVSFDVNVEGSAEVAQESSGDLIEKISFHVSLEGSLNIAPGVSFNINEKGTPDVSSESSGDVLYEVSTDLSQENPSDMVQEESSDKTSQEPFSDLLQSDFVYVFQENSTVASLENSGDEVQKDPIDVVQEGSADETQDSASVAQEDFCDVIQEIVTEIVLEISTDVIQEVVAEMVTVKSSYVGQEEVIEAVQVISEVEGVPGTSSEINPEDLDEKAQKDVVQVDQEKATEVELKIYAKKLLGNFAALKAESPTMSQAEDLSVPILSDESEAEKPEKIGSMVKSESDPVLLKVLEGNPHQFTKLGRFMTLHKRRKQRLTTRSFRKEIGILDDLQHGPVKCILEQSVQWRFNAFALENVTGGRSLPVFCLHLFHHYDLLDHFNLDVACVWKLFTLIEEGYRSRNPYHNSIHAADVTQAMHCFLQQKKIRDHLQPVEIMASLIGAVAHDMEHPGVNQQFLVNTSNHLSALYQNKSVLENHHWRAGIGCVVESGIAAQMADFWPTLKDQIASLILATDITRQNEFLHKFKKFVEESAYDLKNTDDRHFVLQIALKCADISNPCRPWDLSRKWSMKVCEEFFLQGDYERKLNLPITLMCDRDTTSIPKIQAGFLRYVVAPLVEKWHSFLHTDLTEEMMKHLEINQSKWDSLVEQEEEEEAMTEISEALEEEDESDKSSDNENQRRPLASELVLPGKNKKSESARRCSAPVNLQTCVNSENFRRDSCHFEEKASPQKNSITDNEKLSFRDSQFLFNSSFSLNRIFDETKMESLPLAEVFLPEHSIATLTSIDLAHYINIVVNGNVPVKTLLRQQAYPLVPQPSRIHNTSAAGELGVGVEMIVEDNAQSSSFCSQNFDTATSLFPTLECADGQDDKSEETKLAESAGDNTEIAEGEKKFEKENLDPKVAFFSSNRRSSAPATSDNANDIPRLDMRRCSVPVESNIHGNMVDSKAIHVDMINILNEDGDLNNQNENKISSLKIKDFHADGINEKNALINRNHGSFKTRNKKKYLQRRLSGDTEIFQVTGVFQNDKNGNQSQKETIHYNYHTNMKRRSSLPSEAFMKTDNSN